MAAMAGAGLQMSAARPCITHSRRMFTCSVKASALETKGLAQAKFGSSSCISSVELLQKSFAPAALKLNNVVTRAMASESEPSGSSGLPIDLRGNRIFSFPSIISLKLAVTGVVL